MTNPSALFSSPVNERMIVVTNQATKALPVALLVESSFFDDSCS